MSTKDNHLIDWARAMSEVQALPVGQRLRALLARAGVPFHPEDARLALDASVKLWTLGGLPLLGLMQQGISLDFLVEQTTQSMGAAGAQSYLSLPGGSAQSAYSVIVGEHGHTSVAHTVSVSLVVAGVSCAVANEFNSQRDIVHLARVTEARSACQTNPPLMLLEPSLLSVYQQCLDAIEGIAVQAREFTRSNTVEPRDAHEAINSLFPANKATLFVITASLRNFQKLLSAQHDEGKEKEFRRALGHIRTVLAAFWPALF